MKSFGVTSILGLLALGMPSLAADERKATGAHYKVDVVRDIAYYHGKDADPVKHKLDLYLPKDKKDFPVLLFIHGGKWETGDKNMYGGLGNVFAKTGVGTVIISYRLSPKVQHPAHIQDVAKAFAWTHANIGKYGGRADQIFVAGHSAGGHLCALLATNEKYLKAEKLSLSDIKGAIPLSGVYRISPGRLKKAFADEAEICRDASPLAHVGRKQPPFLIIYADKDYSHLDTLAEEMGKALQKKKCDVEVLQIKDRDHISIIRKVANADDPTTQAMLAFIGKHSGSKVTKQ